MSAQREQKFAEIYKGYEYDKKITQVADGRAFRPVPGGITPTIFISKNAAGRVLGLHPRVFHDCLRSQPGATLSMGNNSVSLSGITIPDLVNTFDRVEFKQDSSKDPRVSWYEIIFKPPRPPLESDTLGYPTDKEISYEVDTYKVGRFIDELFEVCFSKSSRNAEKQKLAELTEATKGVPPGAISSFINPSTNTIELEKRRQRVDTQISSRKGGRKKRRTTRRR